MDIYQIWTTYNKKWSKYEILAFSVLLLLTVIVVAGCVCRKKINIIQAMAIVTMVILELCLALRYLPEQVLFASMN
mgnify:CR=1 FL=1